jgi:hypothetical protein
VSARMEAMRCSDVERHDRTERAFRERELAAAEWLEEVQAHALEALVTVPPNDEMGPPSERERCNRDPGKALGAHPPTVAPSRSSRNARGRRGYTGASTLCCVPTLFGIWPKMHVGHNPVTLPS